LGSRLAAGRRISRLAAAIIAWTLSGKRPIAMFSRIPAMRDKSPSSPAEPITTVAPSQSVSKSGRSIPRSFSSMRSRKRSIGTTLTGESGGITFKAPSERMRGA
jgi:hypothetical protein